MNHQPRKRFGQNFLNDAQVISRIIESINPGTAQNMVEVGPGLGALTLPLLERVSELQVIEIDRDLIAKLQQRQLTNLVIHERDVLTVDWSSLAGEQHVRVVGNLPYNIGTPLLLKLLDAREHVQDVHVMLQKEVVDRLCAQTGTRAYGRLSVLMQSCFDIQALFDVPPEAFTPPPKVQSAVVRLTPLTQSPNAELIEKLSQATRLAFGNKRKTLRNNLKKTLSAESLSAAGIDPQARAETLTLEQFLLIAKMLP